ncbi:luciferin 4-monooxygenase-like isoform X1 [Atheta coriaria]|uniref:luciferin 4-monooxygenase-like isoform X1 n=1 Tax=Dalotia coriaria TaxID=877792 RepID=UPI0031F45CF0
MSVTISNNIIKGPPVTAQCPKEGLGCMIFAACTKYAKKICHISPCGNELENFKSETFESFKDRSSRVAKELIRRGVKPKDVIVNCCPNHYDSAITTAACLYIGAISSTLDPTLSHRECGHLLKLIEPKFIFVHEDALELIEESLKISGLNESDIHPQIVIQGSTGDNKKNVKYDTFKTFLQNDAKGFKPRKAENLDENCLIMFSSGSTGLSKGICVSHKSFFLGAHSLLELLDDTTCILHYSTLYWVSAIMIFIATFINGSCRLAARSFIPEDTCKLIQKHNITSAFMATPMAYQFEALKHLSKKYNISSLKSILLGGGPLSAEQMVKARECLPHCSIFLGYGMTEVASCVVGYLPQDRKDFLQYPSSCGRPMRGMQLKIVDPESNKLLGPDEMGEILFKPPSKLLGYYKKTEDSYDADGFFKSGDIGYFNQHFLIYVCDRIKDMFKYMSWHIVPAAVEAVIKEHPAVQECVVFGIPSEIAENLPAAAVVLKPGCNIKESDIEDFVAELVVDREKLRGGVYFVENMPKTPSGKIQRRKVKDMLLKCMPR